MKVFQHANNLAGADCGHLPSVYFHCSFPRHYSNHRRVGYQPAVSFEYLKTLTSGYLFEFLSVLCL